MRYHTIFRWSSRVFFILLAISIIPTNGFSNEPATAQKEIDVYYTIQKGDTLWDLSQKFMDSPYEWPDVWKDNSQIPNPHWIYPGERIRLYHRKDLEKFMTSLPKVVEKKTPVQERPYYYYKMIDTVGFIRKVALKPVAQIMKVKNAKKLIHDRDEIFIKQTGSAPLEAGARFIIYRTGDPLHDRKTNEYIGIQHYMIGIAKVVEKVKNADSTNQYYVAIVEKAFQSINIEDMLTPYIERSPAIQLSESVADLKGKIIKAQEDTYSFGERNIVFIDKGELNGIEPGQVYSIYYTERLDEKTTKDINFGTLLVLHTEKSTATCQITGSRKDIYAGASIRTPEK